MPRRGGASQMRSGSRSISTHGGRAQARQHGVIDSGAAAAKLPVFDALKMAVGGEGESGRSANSEMPRRSPSLNITKK
jgi:hypothetical protein